MNEVSSNRVKKEEQERLKNRWHQQPFQASRSEYDFGLHARFHDPRPALILAVLDIHPNAYLATEVQLTADETEFAIDFDRSFAIVAGEDADLYRQSRRHPTGKLP